MTLTLLAMLTACEPSKPDYHGDLVWSQSIQMTQTTPTPMIVISRWTTPLRRLV